MSEDDRPEPMSLEDVRRAAQKGLPTIAKDKPILTAKLQRVVWARLTMVKRLLIKAGLTTHEEFEHDVEAMVRDIDNKVEENLAKELGLNEPEEK